MDLKLLLLVSMELIVSCNAAPSVANTGRSQNQFSLNIPNQGNEQQETSKFVPAKPLDSHHVLLGKLFETARKIPTNTAIQDVTPRNVFLLDFNVKQLIHYLADLNPAPVLTDTTKDMGKHFVLNVQQNIAFKTAPFCCELQ